jgi:hypothetical protein
MIDAMKKGLEALQGSGYYDTTQQREAITALRQAIAEAEKPVAKVVLTDTIGLPLLQWLDLDRQFDFKGGEFLYTAPPKRQWVGLTDQEIWEADGLDDLVWGRNIEAKLRERNT